MNAFANLFVPKTHESYASRIERIKKIVGNTPIEHVDTVNGNKILAKLEHFNPFSHSVKDRTASYMLTGPLERGEIDPLADVVWIEASSGNLGIAYGKIGSYLGLKTVIVTPSTVGETTFKRVRASATDCEMTPDGYCPVGERDGAIKRVMNLWLSDPHKFVWRDQYSSEDTIRAHEETTGPEIWRQTRGKVTVLVVGTGTGGTLIGSGRYLKEQNPVVEIIAVQPQRGHHIQGVRNFKESMKPLIVEENEALIDGWVEVSDRKALDATEFLWRRGYPDGTSSGLNYAATRKVARERKNALIVTLFPDVWINSFKIAQNYFLTGEIKDI